MGETDTRTGGVHWWGDHSEECRAANDENEIKLDKNWRCDNEDLQNQGGDRKRNPKKTNTRVNELKDHRGRI